jgi:predicted lipid carrier protein YhbT
MTVRFDAGGPSLAEPGPAPAAVAGTMLDVDFAALLRGELAADTAYMQGRLKLAGDGRAVLEVLRATATTAFRAMVAAVEEVTAPA